MLVFAIGIYLKPAATPLTPPQRWARYAQEEVPKLCSDLLQAHAPFFFYAEDAQARIDAALDLDDHHQCQKVKGGLEAVAR